MQKSTTNAPDNTYTEYSTLIENKYANFIESIKALIRPFITYVGFLTFIFMAIKLLCFNKTITPDDITIFEHVSKVNFLIILFWFIERGAQRTNILNILRQKLLAPINGTSKKEKKK